MPKDKITFPKNPQELKKMQDQDRKNRPHEAEKQRRATATPPAGKKKK